MHAGIELGGTKTVVATGKADGTVMEEWRFPTTSPEETFGRAAAWLAERGEPESIGIAAFGPAGVVPGRANYGCILATPKAGWAGIPVVEYFQNAFPGARVTLETDVNAAALGEARLGAAQGYDDVAYITIGTGIGAGILSGGRLIHGALHPEFGHLKTPRHPDDRFAGICSFHGDCLEGMASGPAMEARWGEAAAGLPQGHPAWEMEAWYLTHGVLALLSVVSPSRVIIGGGVSQAPGFHPRVNELLRGVAAGYFPPIEGGNYVLAPALGQKAGICGALLLSSGA